MLDSSNRPRTHPEIAPHNSTSTFRSTSSFTRAGTSWGGSVISAVLTIVPDSMVVSARRWATSNTGDTRPSQMGMAINITMPNAKPVPALGPLAL